MSLVFGVHMRLGNLPLAAILLAVSLATANAQELSGIPIGGDRTSLEVLAKKPKAYEELQGYDIRKYDLEDGNELSVSIRSKTGKISYIETNWNGDPRSTATDFDGLSYGKSKLSDIRKKFGSNGLSFAQLPSVTMTSDRAVILFNGYEVQGSDAYVVFVTRISHDRLLELEKTSSNVKLEGLVGPNALLDTIIVADKTYVNSDWGGVSGRDNTYRSIAWNGPDKLLKSNSSLPLATIKSEYKPQAYRGMTKLPDFNGNAREYRSYRTRITNGMKEGPNFAGEFSIIEIGCGSSCRIAYVGNNRTGDLFPFPGGGEDYYMLTLLYSVDSSVLRAQWADFDKKQCYIDTMGLMADGKSFYVPERTVVGSMDDCYASIEDNVSKMEARATAK